MESKNEPKYLLTALLLFGFSWFYFICSFKLKWGNIRYPGPGFIPMVVGCLLLLSTGIYLFLVLGKRSSAGEEGAGIPEGEKNYKAIVGILACTVLFPLILESLKFIVSTLAAAFIMLFLLKPQRPLVSFFFALGMAVVSFLIFSRLLGVALPSGYLENLFFLIGG